MDLPATRSIRPKDPRIICIEPRKMSANVSSSNGIMNAATTSAKSAKRVSKKVEEAPAPVVVAAPVVEATKAKATKKAEKKVEAPVAATTTTTTAPVATTTPAVAEEIKLEQEVKDAVANLVKLRESLTEAIKSTQKLQKKAARLQKVADKRRKRKAEAGADGKPARISIFQVPQPLSNELCSFMGCSNGSKESRSNVTKFVTKYVKDHNLKTDKHSINPDAKLKALLKVPEGETLSYFNLQKYLNIHYLKNTTA
jgi:chromatin remodeling complex protein RSC6